MLVEKDEMALVPPKKSAKPKKSNHSLYVDDELWADLAAEAEKSGYSLSEFLNLFLREALDLHQGKKKKSP